MAILDSCTTVRAQRYGRRIYYPLRKLKAGSHEIQNKY